MMVACAHLWERALPLAHPGVSESARTLPRFLNFGRTGVLLFFAISGFVIYRSLRGPRQTTGRRFVITRFFRLYPAYWVSLVGGLIFVWWWRGQPSGWEMIAANVTMLPRIFGQPFVMGLYWTLETELCFYAVCWFVWRLDYLEDARVLVGLVIGLTLLWLAVKGARQLAAVTDDLSGQWKDVPRHLALMFWGAYFRVVYDETGGFRQQVRENRRLLVLIGLTAVILFADGLRGFRFVIHPTRIPPSAYVIAPILFWLWVAWLRVRFGILAWLGRISYSLYLFHLVVATPLFLWMATRPNESLRGWPVPFYVVSLFALTVIVSALVYYTVEKPSIALGRRFAPAKN